MKELSERLYLSRRDFLKVIGVIGATYGFYRWIENTFPRYEKPKETISPEEEARRKLEMENFEYLAKKIGGDGA